MMSAKSRTRRTVERYLYCVSLNRMKVPERSSSQTIQAKGIYRGAEVVRGLDWADEYGDQDGKNTCFTIRQATDDDDD